MPLHKRREVRGKDNCYSNAVRESFFHILAEHIHRFNYQTRDQAKRSVFLVYLSLLQSGQTTFRY